MLHACLPVCIACHKMTLCVIVLLLITTCSGSILYQTASGHAIMGRQVGNTSTIYFESIRYTQPLGPHNRFERAKPIPFSEMTTDATTPQHICPQYSGYNFNYTQKEDCLYLSLTLPNHNLSKPYPVIVFIHGGGHFIGSSIDSYISGLPFTRHNIIFISINYRLGYLGTIIHSQSPIINIAQYDQMEALRWIKTNIHQFNGDPSRVTVMGESAGANSIMMLLLSNTVRTENLFQRAILMSGDIANFAPRISQKDLNYYQHQIYYKRFGLKNDNDTEQWEGLKRLDVRTLSHFGYFRLPPTWFLMRNAKIKPMFADGDDEHEIDFNRHPMNVLKSGDFHKVPVIIGTTSNEGALFYPFVCPLIDANEEYVRKMLKVAFPQTMDVNEVYELIGNETTHGTAQEILTEIIGMHSVYTSYLFMKWFTRHGADVYQYVWNISNDPIDGDYFAWHGDELPHIFETYLDFHGVKLKVDHSNITKGITQAFVDYLASFVKTGDPNDGNTHSPVKWNRFSDSSGDYMVVHERHIAMRMYWKRPLLMLYDKLFDGGWLSKGDVVDLSEFEPVQYYIMHGLLLKYAFVCWEQPYLICGVLIAVMLSILICSFKEKNSKYKLQ
eukprot:539881_1